MVINNSEIQLFLSQASVTKLFGNRQVLHDCKNEDACILKFHLLLHSLNDSPVLSVGVAFLESDVKSLMEVAIGV